MGECLRGCQVAGSVVAAMGEGMASWHMWGLHGSWETRSSNQG